MCLCVCLWCVCVCGVCLCVCVRMVCVCGVVCVCLWCVCVWCGVCGSKFTLCCRWRVVVVMLHIFLALHWQLHTHIRSTTTTTYTCALCYLVWVLLVVVAGECWFLAVSFSQYSDVWIVQLGHPARRRTRGRSGEEEEEEGKKWKRRKRRKNRSDDEWWRMTSRVCGMWCGCMCVVAMCVWWCMCGWWWLSHLVAERGYNLVCLCL